ncbi:hypothetical protein TSUD_293340 [Trifolium subterraneum]|uniref:Reverse transcriptase zinc-binding domain-containing protein n=1 Tax=Trifolium subterraneum TaxID=3900 RepID=A0A2Z6MVE9_TRISU|nr:hypothetical protein TSUD_293340 [Trifolium subterraneum]
MGWGFRGQEIVLGEVGADMFAQTTCGGLGVKNLEFFNAALLSKWKWRCVNESDAVWSNVLRFRYGHLPSKFLKGESLSLGVKDSIWWKDLVGVGDSIASGWFRTNVGCIVGNGKNIDFWKQKWFGNNPFCELFPNLLVKEANNNAMIADRLISNVGGPLWNWTWRECLSVHEEQELTHLKELLRGFSLNLNCCDKWRWVPDTNGIFTVQSCYNLLLRYGNVEIVPLHVLEAIRKLWKNNLPSKVGVFGWRLLLEKLPT